MKNINPRQKRKIVEEWIKNNGAASFDLKNRDIILYDGGLFSISKELKWRHRSKFVPITEGPWKGGSRSVEVKGPKVRYEDYKAVFWFEELDDTINYFKRMKKMLNKIGYKTGRRYK